jgi:hypothetical protein
VEQEHWSNPEVDQRNDLLRRGPLDDVAQDGGVFGEHDADVEVVKASATSQATQSDPYRAATYLSLAN